MPPPKKVRKPAKETDPRMAMIRRQLVVGLLLAVLIGTVLSGVYYGSRIESLQITDVKVVGGKTIPHKQVEDITRQAFTGSYLRLIPKSFKATFPEKVVKQSVQSVDRINNVQVELEGKTVIVVYDEYIPFALWCGEHDSTDCLFLDRDAYAFGSAPALEGSAFVRFVDEGVVPKKHEHVFSVDFIRAQQELIEDMERELGLYVTHVEKIGDYDLEYTVSGGGTIKTSQTMEADTTFSNLRTILLSEDFAHLTPGNFKYIDLRFGDKVFVNEEMGAPATTASSTSE